MTNLCEGDWYRKNDVRIYNGQGLLVFQSSTRPTDGMAGIRGALQLMDAYAYTLRLSFLMETGQLKREISR